MRSTLNTAGSSNLNDPLVTALDGEVTQPSSIPPQQVSEIQQQQQQQQQQAPVRSMLGPNEDTKKATKIFEIHSRDCTGFKGLFSFFAILVIRFRREYAQFDFDAYR